jgi:glucose-1-phosphate thymidylyltransferase
MRATVSGAAWLTAEQGQAADQGMKGMIPIGRPFLDYCISALADAGCTEICLVIGPEHGRVRDYYHSVATSRVSITFAIQTQPLGTADALRAALKFVGNESFIVVNSDNYYPAEALHQLRLLGGSGVIGFETSGLLADGSLSEDRLRAYALLQVNDRGELVGIEEKPAAIGPHALISMNSWSFTPAIFRACAEIGPSVRGEYEIPNAVQYAIERLGERFAVIPFRGTVLDLSNRADVPQVARRLEGRPVQL